MDEFRGFGARDYFASYDPRQNRRKKRNRQMTPRQRAVFEEAMELLKRDVPVETLERMIRKEVSK